MSNRDIGGVGFLGLLTLLFIGLKLTGHIAWSWVWVLSPIWIAWGIALLIFAIAGLLVVLNERATNRNIKR